MNRDSTWSVKECRKLPLLRRKRMVMKTQFIMNKIRLKIKNTMPIASSHVDRYATFRVSDFHDLDVVYLLECSAFAMPPVAIV